MTGATLNSPKIGSRLNRSPSLVTGFNFIRFKKITEVGIKSIYSHRLRSLLTVLGIVIGVAAVM